MHPEDRPFFCRIGGILACQARHVKCDAVSIGTLDSPRVPAECPRCGFRREADGNRGGGVPGGPGVVRPAARGGPPSARCADRDPGLEVDSPSSPSMRASTSVSKQRRTGATAKDSEAAVTQLRDSRRRCRNRSARRRSRHHGRAQVETLARAGIAGSRHRFEDHLHEQTSVSDNVSPARDRCPYRHCSHRPAPCSCQRHRASRGDGHGSLRTVLPAR